MSLDFDGVRWRKSSYSDESGGVHCVEIGRMENNIVVRDSKNPGSGSLSFSLHEWGTFTTGIKHAHLVAQDSK